MIKTSKIWKILTTIWLWIKYLFLILLFFILLSINLIFRIIFLILNPLFIDLIFYKFGLSITLHILFFGNLLNCFIGINQPLAYWYFTLIFFLIVDLIIVSIESELFRIVFETNRTYPFFRLLEIDITIFPNLNLVVNFLVIKFEEIGGIFCPIIFKHISLALNLVVSSY